jgi:hypothetical protein
LPHHEDRTPSFTVYHLSNNSWYCFGACRRGGDVVDLAAAAWGYGEGEMAMAAAALLHAFGHSIPERPRSWYAKHSRQQPVRDEVGAIRFRHLRRRLFRLFVPMIERIVDADERREEAERVWEETEYLARLLCRRVGEGAQQ